MFFNVAFIFYLMTFFLNVRLIYYKCISYFTAYLFIYSFS